ncbi:LysR family transcriptional regulator [Salinisphaera sp. Q1T1-3]|nr:LysR family transcriptional regulator [Salinisphaera sp. Q1T1-3]
MTLHSLALFVALADAGSFSIAARRMHTVQSNVTAHIKKLEHELGVTLFERNGGVRLTPAGHTLMSHARDTLGAHEAALSAFRPSEPPRGVLHLGALESTAAVRLPDLLAAFHRRHIEVTLQLTTGTTAELLAGLAAGRLDAAFIAGERVPADRWTRAAFRESLVLIGAEPLTAMPSAAALAETPFLAFRQGCHYRECIERLLARQGVSGTRIFELGSIDGILGCVAAGMGYGLMPASVVAAHRHRFGIHALPLPADLGEVTTHLVATAQHGWSPALSCFAGMLDDDPPRTRANPAGVSA